MRLPMALSRRLDALSATGDCCQDLPALVASAKAAPDADTLRSRYEALGDERRMLVACMLRRRPGLCACELQAGLGIGHATVSHHMAVLQEAGLVAAERDGRWVRYRLSDAAAALVP